jgi:hypothetical protein
LSLQKKNHIEKFECKIDRFWKGSSGKAGTSPAFKYKFLKSYEEIKVNYNVIKPCLDKNPNDYKLIITARKTAWDYYILDDWKVEKKLDTVF